MKYVFAAHHGRCQPKGRSPSWGAWIEIFCIDWGLSCTLVAPPRGERGLKSLGEWGQKVRRKVAPPRGERGLKSAARDFLGDDISRSPSWGAWIEITLGRCTLAESMRRSPSWGAWIEIRSKSLCTLTTMGRSPSWGAWIEMPKNANRNHKHSVAPPRGERGLKSDLPELPRESRLVAPPRGERGLK